MNKSNLEIKLENSLQAYFFDELMRINTNLSRPLPQLTVFYSSLVMDRFTLSNDFYQISEGKTKDKVLGVKLLKVDHLPDVEKKRELQDIADTALFLCGYLSSSLMEKLVDSSYYSQIGKVAYSRLDNYRDSFYDKDGFFKYLSGQFCDVVSLMSLLSPDCKLNEKQFLLSDTKAS